MDAQSALRRCIELFSHNTRFFIIVEDKYKLLKPILSRFCEIYVSEPEYKGKTINLYKYNLDETFKLTNVKQTKAEWLKKELQKPITIETDLVAFSTKLYEKGYSALDLIKLLEDQSSFKIDNINVVKKYELLVAFNKVRKEFRNEKLLMLFIMNFVFLDIETNLDNISFM
jgi:DNA polymerase III delta prime subunit